MRNVKDYGAVGDGVSLDTKAIQKAIDLGGTVYIPEGIYRVGTLYLRSNGGPEQHFLQAMSAKTTMQTIFACRMWFPQAKR